MKTLLGIFSLAAFALAAQAQETISLIDLSGDDWAAPMKVTSPQVSLSKSTISAEPGINVSVEAGENAYPGFRIKAKGDQPFDLAKYGHIEAKITNTGTVAISVTMRADNEGDASTRPWNTAMAGIKPGETKTMRLIFGYYDKKKVQDINTAKIIQLLFFTGKAKEKVTYCIESLTAGGQPGETPAVDPQSIRIVPKDGWLLGNGVTAGQAQAVGDAKSELLDNGTAVKALLPANKLNAAVFIQPAQGRWDLRDYIQVTVTVRNSGKQTVTPRAAAKSNGGDTMWVAADPLAPGAETAITVPFMRTPPWQWLPDKEEEAKNRGLYKFANNTVRGIVVTTAETDANNERALTVTAIRAELPAPQLPDWLGKRPPVTEGDWTLTFEDNFEAPAIDESKWSYYGPNFWDKKSHFTKEDTYTRDGNAILRFKKQRGWHNDNPETNKETDYSSGYLSTYGKWSQRYGYYEARLKPPRANGLWPAFWLMPDRGIRFAPEQWKRQDIASGGMEFDIYEHLTGWGPQRYTSAYHWDGYGKDHKAAGAGVYTAPDKDGYITTGLLWLPGLAVYYCNGREVGRMADPRVCNVSSEIIFTLPSGGWDNTPLNDAELKDGNNEFIIDYVRVWQRKDLASTEDGYWNPDGSPRENTK